MTPNSAAVNSKNLQKSTVSSMSSVRPTTQSLAERRREPFRLSKNLWWKNSDKHLALLNYWMTPLPRIELLPAQLLMGHRLWNELPMMDSLIRLASVNQKDVSMYLKKTKEDQKKYHVRHASSEMKDLQPRPKVRMQPWTDSRKWKPVTVVRQKNTPRSYVVQAEDDRKYGCDRQQLQVCPAPGHGSLNVELSLDGTAHQNLTKDETDHAAAPAVLPLISPQGQHHDPEPPRWTSQSLMLPEVADE